MGISWQWSGSESFVEIITDGHGNFIGAIRGGNRVAAIEELQRTPSETLTVEEGTTLYDVTSLFFSEFRRARLHADPCQYLIQAIAHLSPSDFPNRADYIGQLNKLIEQLLACEKSQGLGIVE
jgi:hypothetical protein